MNPSTETSVADDELAAFVDRVLRMKSEEDAIKADIREIYAEAKGRGYDKTRLGEVVAHVRKVEKDASGEAEKEAIRDLYLTAYYRAKNKPHAHAYARGVESTTQNASVSRHDSAETGDLVTTPEHDPETGEITEPQSPPQAEQDGGAVSEVKGSARLENAVGVEPSPSTPIQPEPLGALSEVALPTTDEDTSLSGRGRASGTGSAGGDGSSPSQAPISYPAPGVVVMETCPPEGALAHPYAACWPVRDIDVSEGVREPIVKIGKLILDGRGRMFAARGWDGGKGREYPVVQYYGTDPLMDCIRWNLASRPGIHSHNLKLIAGKLAKLEPTRADEIMQAFGLEVAEAAQ